MEQLELNLNEPVQIPDSVVFPLSLDHPDTGTERHVLEYATARQLAQDLNEWLDFVEGRANGR